MMRLLAPPSGWKGYATAIVLGVLANLAWSIASTAALWAVGIEVEPVVGADLFESWAGLAVIWPAAAIEELLFRVPLAIPAVLGWERLLPPSIAALSVLFGLAHGGGFPHVLVQGGAGVVLSFVFLRCGGLHRRVARGWVCATASHGLFDTTLWTLIFLSGP